MVATVCLNQTDALALQAALDTQLGYPRAGVNVGGGVHVPPAQAVTTHAAVPFKHPVSTLWAVQESPEISSVVGGPVAIPIGATAHTSLDGTWGVG